MQNQGFTLTDTLTAMTIVCLLMVIGAPISSLVKQQRLNNSAHEFSSALRFARSRAVLGQTGVTVAAKSGSWGNGWTIFTDPNRNAQLDAGETLLISQSEMPDVNVVANSPVRIYIHYSAHGASQLSNGGFQAGTLRFCSQDTSLEGIRITLNSTGKTRSSEDACQ